MNNQLKQKKTLFDGDQNDLQHTLAKIKCPKCAASIEIGLVNLRSISSIPAEHRSELLANMKGVKVTNMGGHSFYKYEFMPVMHIEATCKICLMGFDFVFGAGEFQPARYMVVLGGVFEKH